MNNLRFLIKYFKYITSARTLRSIHSPFVYELVEKVFRSKGNYYAFEKIENLRRKLLLSHREINVEDFGTGKSGRKSIREIAEHSLTNAKYGQLLFRLANYFSPSVILELGTSLGISTAYLAKANSKAKVITIEGSEAIANEAKKNFETLGIKNIEVVTGNFDDVLSNALCQLRIVNCLLVFFDGNHRKEPTLRYFHECRQYATNDSVFIFDDIHWSSEMEEAWKEIKKCPEVTVTIDLFFPGLVFFRKEQAKQDFIVRF